MLAEAGSRLDLLLSSNPSAVEGWSSCEVTRAGAAGSLGEVSSLPAVHYCEFISLRAKLIEAGAGAAIFLQGRDKSRIVAVIAR